MDVDNPLRSVAPTVDADVLAVLARTHAPLTGRRVQELAGRSYGQVRSVLHRLVDHGLVVSERYGTTGTYLLNRGHVLAAPLASMVDAAAAVEDEARELASRWEPEPEVVVLFGSFARRDGGADSDIDLLVVRPDSVDPDHAGWADQRRLLVTSIEQRSGNRVQLVDLSAAELGEAAAGDEPLIDSLRRDGVVLCGAAPTLDRPTTARQKR